MTSTATSATGIERSFRALNAVENGTWRTIEQALPVRPAKKSKKRSENLVALAKNLKALHEIRNLKLKPASDNNHVLSVPAELEIKHLKEANQLEDFLNYLSQAVKKFTQIVFSDYKNDKKSITEKEDEASRTRTFKVDGFEFSQRLGLVGANNDLRYQIKSPDGTSLVLSPTQTTHYRNLSGTSNTVSVLDSNSKVIQSMDILEPNYNPRSKY